MRLKTIEIEGKTYAEVQNGNPVFIDGGKEIAFDAPGTIQTISRLNGEAKGHREAKEAAEKALKQFEGIKDPQAALDALNTVSNIDMKKMIDAGEVEKVKDEITKVFQGQLAEKDTEIGGLKSTLHKEKIGGSFARSKFISEKVAIPADLIEAQFGRYFTLEDGNVVAKDSNGNPIYSPSKPGELAGFDEALETIIGGYAHKDSILKGTGNSGSGSDGGNGGGNNGPKTIPRAQFERLSSQEQSAKMKDGYTLAD